MDVDITKEYQSFGSGEITVLLQHWALGDRVALGQAFERLMPELRAIAHNKLMGEFRASGMQTTELLNETCVAVMGIEALSLASRRHFFRMVAQKMSHYLIDLARKRKTTRHGGLRQVDLEQDVQGHGFSLDMIIALDEALDRLKAEDPELYEVVELKGIAGFQDVEAAEILGLPLSSFKRKWQFARALLTSWLPRYNEP